MFYKKENNQCLALPQKAFITFQFIKNSHFKLCVLYYVRGTDQLPSFYKTLHICIFEKSIEILNEIFTSVTLWLVGLLSSIRHEVNIL